VRQHHDALPDPELFAFLEKEKLAEGRELLVDFEPSWCHVPLAVDYESVSKAGSGRPCTLVGFLRIPSDNVSGRSVNNFLARR
jgi:hypothetical protein